VRADHRQIARAFLVPESTVAQRITRAKRKITDAGIPYRMPDDDELGARLTEVLAVIYLLFNEGYLRPPTGRRHATWPTTPSGWPACCTS
jgi:RNA polymerase sigma-70 factor (ECF subfamily)